MEGLKTMALASDGSERYQLVDCVYTCKLFKTIQNRYLREQCQHIYKYHYKQEIFVQQARNLCSQQQRNLLKYKHKRCNCKTKRPLSEIKISCKNYDRETNQIKSDINCLSETCSSMIAEVWCWPYITPVRIANAVANYISKQWSNSLSLNAATSSSLEAVPATISSSCSPRFPIIYDTFDWTSNKMKSAFCDNSSNYLEKKINSKYKILTYKNRQTHPLKHHKIDLQLINCYILMMFIMIVKELIRYISDRLNRFRRRTQVILPLLILLQFIVAVPLTNCTSPPNQTISDSMSQSSSKLSSASMTSNNMNPTSTTSLAIPRDANTAPESILYQRKTSTAGSLSSYRPSGGSSITSYMNHEVKVRRDPGFSFAGSGCHSCQMREQVKAENLESIKRHILLRLEMQSLPNITATQVPQSIIENFYKNHSLNNNKKLYSSNADTLSAGNNELLYTSKTNVLTNRNDETKKSENNMQGDDPNILSDDYSQAEEEYESDEELQRNNLEDEFYSVVNSVYVFPTMPRMRHNRKAEILNFKFKSKEHATVAQALLHVYIRGRDWIREYEPEIAQIKNSIGDDWRDIIITVNRVIRRINSTVATHTINVTESQHKIPNGLGQWVSIDVTQLVQGWLRNTTTNQGIVIKGTEGWMKPFIITGDSPNNKAYTVYIEMLTKDNRKRRTKRNTSMNCSESDNEERCCRYPLVVNFVEFEWTWVVAPTSFNAYFCNGECKLGFLEKYPHTHLMQLSTAPQPCCSPTKMSPLKLLYFNAENTLVMSTIPNMAVEKCSCS